MDGLLIPFYIKAMPSLPYPFPIRMSLRYNTPLYANSNQQPNNKVEYDHATFQETCKHDEISFFLFLSLFCTSNKPQETSSYPQPQLRSARPSSGISQSWSLLPVLSCPFLSLSYLATELQQNSQNKKNQRTKKKKKRHYALPTEV